MQLWKDGVPSDTSESPASELATFVATWIAGELVRLGYIAPRGSRWFQRARPIEAPTDKQIALFIASLATLLSHRIEGNYGYLTTIQVAPHCDFILGLAAGTAGLDLSSMPHAAPSFHVWIDVNTATPRVTYRAGCGDAINLGFNPI